MHAAVRFAAIAALGSFTACAASPSTPAEPAEAVAHDPLHAPPELCHAQSPINILTSSIEGGEDPMMHKVAMHYQSAEETIQNLGHTVEVDFAPGSTLDFDGKTYNFRQFHFHTPSEHQVDGITYAMEMHMVHTLEGDENTYLVIGLLFKNGEQNEFLDSFLDALPQVEGGKVMKEPGAVDITTVVSADEPFFHYAGSLTTPPYTESVTWLVAERAREATEDQIQAFRAIEKNNARVVQSRNGRAIDEV